MWAHVKGSHAQFPCKTVHVPKGSALNVTMVQDSEGDGWEVTFNEPDGGQQRFIAELEFVQCLANPEYIHCECPPFVKTGKFHADSE